MFYPQGMVGSNTIRSDMQVLTEQFLNGDILAIQLSDLVFGNIARTRQGSYTEYVNKVKQILSHSKINYHYDLMIIKSSVEITEDIKAVLIRFVNLSAAHNTKIVLFNNNIIYIPSKLMKYGEDAVNAHVNSAYRDFTNKRKTKLFARKFSLKRLIPFLH